MIVVGRLTAAAFSVMLVAVSACSGSEGSRAVPPVVRAETANVEWLDGAAPRGAPPISAVEVRPDVHELTYTDVTGADRTIQVEVRMPNGGPATRPVVVWSHGGSTGKKSTANVGNRWGKAINDADFVFVAIAHRGRSDQSRIELCGAVEVVSCAEFKYLLWDRLNDVALVFDWLEQSAVSGELFVDMDRLVYGGHSAGAMAVMVMAGMESPYATGVPMPTDDRPAAFLVASPPGAEENGFEDSAFDGLDRPMLLLTGDGDTTGGTIGADRLALFDLIDSAEVMLISTDSEQVGHTTFDLNTQPCIRAGGSQPQCREALQALRKTAQLFLRAAVGSAGLDVDALVAQVADRLPSHMELLSAAG